jgi:ATP-dependent Lhr-like helicase
VVFRELLEREAPELAWPRLFRALRLLELGGELVAGQFVAGVQGAQFASPRAVRALEQGLDETRVCWMNAADPASPCGLGLPGLEGLPRRLPVHHLVLHGSRLVVISERRGARLEVRAPPGDPRLPEYLGFLSSMLTRPVRPARSVRIETINGEPAAASAYRGVLGELFHTARDLSTLRLMRRYP